LQDLGELRTAAKTSASLHPPEYSGDEADVTTPAVSSLVENVRNETQAPDTPSKSEDLVDDMLLGEISDGGL
jgi:hypothetical protein